MFVKAIKVRDAQSVSNFNGLNEHELMFYTHIFLFQSIPGENVTWFQVWNGDSLGWGIEDDKRKVIIIEFSNQQSTT